MIEPCTSIIPACTEATESVSVSVRRGDVSLSVRIDDNDHGWLAHRGGGSRLPTDVARLLQQALVGQS